MKKGDKDYYNKKELDFIIDKIDKDKRFSILSFGDGEWSFVFDRENHHEVAEREYFTEELWIRLLQALNISRKDDVYLTTTIGTYGEIGYEKLHKKARAYLRMMGLRPTLNLKDARVFYETLHQCFRRNPDALKDFVRFIRTLRKKDVVLVGDEHLREVITEGFLPDADFIEIPKGKASKHLHDICYSIIMYRKPAYFFLSCGLATGGIMAELHSRVPESSFLDVGAMWDFILMKGDRAEHKWEGLKEEIKKQLNA